VSKRSLGTMIDISTVDHLGVSDLSNFSFLSMNKLDVGGPGGVANIGQ